jgi:Cytoskeletal-regulatory complex EF hand
LFATADIERTGKIGGAQAVQFFQRSKLPVDALKNIWIVADSPPTNYLDPPKFAVAVRLIQCIQNGQKGSGTNLLSPPGAPPMRPAMFEGVSGVAVQLPGGAAAAGPLPPGQQPPQQQPQQSSPPQQQQQPPPMNGGSSRALAVQDPYMLTPTDQARFEEMFPNYARDGYVHGGEAVALFSKSGMPQAQLAAIWNMVDSPVDNRLDKLEFAMAMHLIVCVSKRNLPMPPSLPASLQQLKSQQQQQPPAPQGQQPQPLQQLRHERTPTYDSMASASMMQGGGGGGGMHGQGGPPPMQQQQQPGMMMQGGQVPPSPQTMKSMAAGYGGMPGTAGGGMPQMQQPLGMQGGPPRPPMQGGGGGSVGGGSLQSSPKPMQGSLPPLSFSMNNMSSLQQPQVHTAPSSPGGGGGGGGGIPSPMAQPHGGFGMQQQAVQYGGFAQQQREMPPPPLHQSYQGQVSPTMSAQTEPVITKQPQHQVNVSSISISDAFEGLDARAVDEQSYASAPQNEQQQQQYGGGHQYGGGIPEPESVTSDTPEKMPSAGGASESLKSSSQRGPFEDTQKLKSTLQKLQAENISLKAQLGSMTEGEREAQAELSKTVAEIGVLSNKLTTLRAQVLAAKSRLLETTAELKAGREKKRYALHRICL